MREFTDLIGKLTAKGTLVFAASGNCGNAEENFFPSCLTDVISVGCHGSNAKAARYSSDKGVNFSCYGEVLAPCFITHNDQGVQLPAPIAALTPVDGTSMATPVAAAVTCLGLQCAERFNYLKAMSRKERVLKMLEKMQNSKGALNNVNTFLTKADAEQFDTFLKQ